ncbi:MAG: hypothetical protein U5R30_12815 [Deltaproteobacteria bacterium]|nr:hypothetical protein [Deltaproteobacteria bacterium]
MKAARQDAEKLFLEMGRRSASEFDVVLNVIETYLEPYRYKDAVMRHPGTSRGLAPKIPTSATWPGIAYYGLKDN